MKKITGKKFIGLLVALIVLGVSSGIGFATNIFKDFSDLKDTIHLDFPTIIKVVIIVALLYSLNFLLQLVFSLFRGIGGRAMSIASITASLIRYTIFIIGFCWTLSLIGVNVSTIFASLGIIALVLGFGAESLIADVVTGIFVLFENQFNVGDIIEVNGFRGTVDSIGIRTISIRDTGENTKIINNSELKNVINRSKAGSVAICDVGVSYSTDLDVLEKQIGAILEDIKNRNRNVFIGDVRYLGVEELADSSVVLRIRADVAEENIYYGRRLLNKEIKCAFDKAGFEIAFPQLDIHQR